MSELLEDWHARVDDLRTELETRLTSFAEFDTSLNRLVRVAGSPASEVQISIALASGAEHLNLGLPGSGPETVRQTVRLGDATAVIRVWTTATSSAEQQAASIAAEALLNTWWRPSDRDGMTGLFQFARPGVPEALLETLMNWSTDGMCPVAFGDIDKFKALNDSLGHSEGDKAIAYAAAKLADLCPVDGVLLRRGGDEFVIAVPPRSLATWVDELQKIRESVEAGLRAKYSTIPELGFSVGAAFIDPSTVDASSLDQRAERSMKTGGQKKRGRVSFESLPQPQGPAQNSSALAATEVVIAQLGDQAPFSNIWLQWLSDVCRELVQDPARQELVSLAVEKIQPTWFRPYPLFPAGEPAGLAPDGSNELAPLDVALGIARGASQGVAKVEQPPTITVAFDQDCTFAKVIVGDEVLFAQGSEPAEVSEVRFPTLRGDPALINARSLVALSIGEASPSRYPELYADHIYLDDRPTRGGGLPDFWEAALAQIVDSLAQHPNVRGVVVHGDPTFGAETMAWLQKEWADTLQYLAQKLNTSSQLLTEVGARLRGRVYVLNELQKAEPEIANEVRSTSTALKADPEPTSRVREPRLRRRLVSRPYALGQEDGCRTRTASEAYPIALDVVRQADPSLNDAQGRPFSELVDFRIHLQEPGEDAIPRYYLADEDALEQYFSREFLETGGKFHDALIDGDQYEHVFGHLCKCLATGAYATRRATLVLPNKPTSSDVLPLGLVSVRIIPRLQDQMNVRLDFSFTWRTVEAIVGLPYSLFGSIRYSQYVVNSVVEKIQPEVDHRISLGELSYIAHSLHIYNDGYGISVARRIVNDESL